MRSPAVVLPALLVVLFLVAGQPLVAQDKSGDAATQEMMKKWQELMSPGAPHKALASLEGNWNAEVRTWLTPDAPPQVSKGTCVYKMVFGGRYLEQTFTSEMMNMPFSGTGYTGYDNANKRFFGFWIDNMSTAMSTMDGTMNKEGNVLTMYGKMDDASTGENGKNIKYITRILSPDKLLFEVYDLTVDEGKSKMMEIAYTRAK
ncbi:MAG TPA: DUF1579 domain-containing protein [Bacteroidota bacterium]|nr:DUF1579 domain-containing protein [Bacteroidota bacterium]